MDHSFKNIDEEKRIRIINNAFKEFASQGYRRSSLNTILKESEVSKGFFYHYFKNKELFYNFLLEYAILIIVEKLNTEKLIEQSDFIKRLQDGALHKIQIAKTYPKLFEFLANYYLSITPEEYLKFAEKISGDTAQRMLTENIDYSLFKDDVPIDVSMKVVHKFIGQVSYELQSKVNIWSYQKIAEYYSNELEDLKKVVYKKGV
ncbi:TetR/AcrR family transcriptional regulator [Candidatus Izimaplasma bacterium]|nr:TetR/AcrR family transcriptional regulator [Candidatus Izimaplasma bacterium]